MTLLGRLVAQAGKPRGRFGRILVRSMNLGHSDLARWGLSQVEIPETATILDIGCGGGRTLARLASVVRQGKAVGIDYSEDSVAVSRTRNRRFIASGRVEVIQASVSSMPFPDATFDFALATESFYFWPDVEGDLAEVRRVMKPSGQLVIISGMYRGSRFDSRNERMIRAGDMRWFSAEELEEALQAAGFVSVSVTVEPPKGWLCAIARDQVPVEN